MTKTIFDNNKRFKDKISNLNKGLLQRAHFAASIDAEYTARMFGLNEQQTQAASRLTADQIEILSKHSIPVFIPMVKTARRHGHMTDLPHLLAKRAGFEDMCPEFTIRRRGEDQINHGAALDFMIICREMAQSDELKAALVLRLDVDKTRAIRDMPLHALRANLERLQPIMSPTIKNLFISNADIGHDLIRYTCARLAFRP